MSSLSREVALKLSFNLPVWSRANSRKSEMSISSLPDSSLMNLEIPVLLLIIERVCLVQEAEHEPADDGEGGLHVVGEGGDEVVPLPFQRFQSRNILERSTPPMRSRFHRRGRPHSFSRGWSPLAWSRLWIPPETKGSRLVRAVLRGHRVSHMPHEGFHRRNFQSPPRP